jgi:hypothetical protein
MPTKCVAATYWKTWRWGRRRMVSAALIVFGVTVLIVLYLLFHEPSWYELPIIAVEERQAVRNNLVAAEQAFTEGLRADVGPFVYHIYQNDVNRWLAMRREIYPLLDELSPSVLADPLVVFDAGKITVAGVYRGGALSAVVSVDIAVNVQTDALMLTVTAARLGSVRMPLSVAGGLGLATTIDKGPDEIWPGSPRVRGSLASGLRVGADARWQNGGVAYRVLDVSVQRGKMDITIEPRGHQAGGVNRKHHSSPSPERASSANRPARR